MAIYGTSQTASGTPTRALPLGAGLFVLFPLAGMLLWFILTGHDGSGGYGECGSVGSIWRYRIKWEI